MKPLLATFVLSTIFSFTASAVDVDLSLVLAADVSGSVDATDFDLQQQGYANAFQSAALLNSIQGGALGRIAVTLVYWSDGAAVAVPWTLIEDAASATAFSAAILAAPRSSSGGTGLTNALDFSTTLFTGSGFTGTREVIDVSGDGAESTVCSFSALNCVPVQNARNGFLGASGNRTINALWIDDRDFFGDDASDQIDALQYGLLNVIGGPGAFQNIVQDFPGFASAIESKLIREVEPSVPEPGTFGLAGLVLAGLAMIGRRKRQRA